MAGPAPASPGTTVLPDDHVYGDPDAPVTVLEYGDYQCPYCSAVAPVLRELVDTSEGRVRLVFRNFPLPDLHPFALTAALAAEAAGAQGAFWPMHHLLFTKQARLTDAALRSYAEHLGLDADLVVGEPAQVHGDKVEADFAAGLEAGVPGTPTLFVDGVRYQGRPDLASLRRAVTGAGRGSPGQAGLQPRPRRERRGLRLRRAQREAVAEEPQDEGAEQRREQ